MRQFISVNAMAKVASVKINAPKHAQGKWNATLTLIANHYDSEGNKLNESVFFVNAFDGAFDYLVDAVRVGDTVHLHDAQLINIMAEGAVDNRDRKMFINVNSTRQIVIVPLGDIQVLEQRRNEMRASRYGSATTSVAAGASKSDTTTSVASASTNTSSNTVVRGSYKY